MEKKREIFKFLLYNCVHGEHILTYGFWLQKKSHQILRVSLIVNGIVAFYYLSWGLMDFCGSVLFLMRYAHSIVLLDLILSGSQLSMWDTLQKEWCTKL